MRVSPIKRRMGEVWEGPKPTASVSSGHITLPAPLAHAWRTTNRESSPEPKCPEIYRGSIT